MSYPLMAYTYIDPSTNNTFPIVNSNFVYGTLGPCNWTGLTSNLTKGYTVSGANYGSLDISSNQLYGNTQLVSLYNYATDASNIARHTISANQSGIYRLKTTLSFSGINLTSTTNLIFFFSNTNADNIILTESEFLGISSLTNSSPNNLTTNAILSFGYMYSNSIAPTSTTNGGGYIYFNPTPTSSGYLTHYYNVYSTITSGVFTNNGLCVVEVILYLQKNIPLYFNIGNTACYINATGNFELEMLYASPSSSNPQYINTLTNYNYNTSSIINNSNFLYGILASSDWISGYTANYTNYGSLDVSTNLYGNTQLVTLQPYTDNNNSQKHTIQVNQSGIYRLRSTLAFTGYGFSVGNIGIDYVFTTAINKNTALTGALLINLNANSIYSNNANSAFVSIGSIYSNNGPGILLNNSSGNIIPVPVFNSYASSATAFTTNGISTFESILYLSNQQPLYFNISCGGKSGYYINANGNFTLELLSSPKNAATISNPVNISNSGILSSNGYNYIEFYPTSDYYPGTSTITFSQNITFNYLLVGGGGGGGGGTYVSGVGDAGGGGGSGSALNGSSTESSFNISVGYLGVGGYGANEGLNGGNSSIGTNTSGTNIAVSYGGGGGGSYNDGTGVGGGVWNPVSDPSGNGTKYLALNGGNAYNTRGEVVSSGLNGYTINLPFKTYNISGSGGGGSLNNSGVGGTNNIGGAGPGTGTGNGTIGNGYGTGGGGGQYTTGSLAGGNGGPGLIVIYWQ